MSVVVDMRGRRLSGRGLELRRRLVQWLRQHPDKTVYLAGPNDSVSLHVEGGRITVRAVNNRGVPVEGGRQVKVRAAPAHSQADSRDDR